MAENNYEDILHRPHHRSSSHRAMSQWERAAQFAPFSALSGHGEGAAETARPTEARRELSEDAIVQLERVLQWVETHLEEHPECIITHFVPDLRKAGGAYVAAVGRIKRIDHHRHLVVLMEGGEIPIEEIISLEPILPQGDMFEDGRGM